MKSDRKPHHKSHRAAPPNVFGDLRILAVALLSLPFVALTPNFFIVPDLQYQGNATQEMVVTITAAILLGLTLIVLFRAKAPLIVGQRELLILAPLAFFVTWATITLAWAPDIAEGVRLIALWLSFAVFFVIAFFQLDVRSAWWMHYALGLLILILAASQVIEYRAYDGEMLGVFFSHGITSELLAVTIPLWFAVYLATPKRWMAIVSLVILAAGGGALLLGLRRGPLLGLTVGGLFLIFAWLRGYLRLEEKWRLIVIFLAVVVMGGGMFAFKREQIVARLRGAFEIQTARSDYNLELGLTSRLTKWYTGWEMAKKNALIGVGNGGFPSEYGKYRRNFVENPSYARVVAASETEDYDEIRSPHVHNEFLQVIDELGLIGFLAWGFFWVMVFRLLWSARHSTGSELPLGALGGLIAFGISSAISGFSMRFSPSTTIVACVAGLGCAVARSISEARNGEESKTGRALPRSLVIAGAALLLLAMVGFSLRNRDVLNSQKAQSQTDFRFSLDSPAINEGLLRRYQQAISLDEANSGAHLGIGLLLYQMKRPGEAIPHLEYAYTHSYSRPYTPVLLAFAYEQTGDLDRAVAILEECLRSFPKSMVARASLAELLDKQGKTPQAAVQRQILEQQHFKLGRAWEIALKSKNSIATAEAKRQGVREPGSLEPMLVRTIVMARAYHYLQ